jgi:hypothetical protein
MFISMICGGLRTENECTSPSISPYSLTTTLEEGGGRWDTGDGYGGCCNDGTTCIPPYTNTNGPWNPPFNYCT